MSTVPEVQDKESETNDQVLDVLDLPQIHTRPSATTLLDTLSLLALQPVSWDGSLQTSVPSRKTVRAEGVPRYLTNIISSSLEWLEDEEKEAIWDLAATRLSERSGRTGMGSLTRTFKIPAADAGDDESMDIQIHEPALTEDNLGLKTWAASYVLAKKWASLGDVLRYGDSRDEGSPSRPDILELGAGTGLVGIAAAAILGKAVLLTDLPEITTNLRNNVESNAEVISARGGSGEVAVLDWLKPEEVLYEGTATSHQATREGLQVPVIVTADPIYSGAHPGLLAQTIDFHLSRSKCARVLVDMPIRDAFAEERASFRQHMSDIGLVLILEETDFGFDDWSDGRGESLTEVECWMSIWAWSTKAGGLDNA